ncbi:MAG TPA: hypothetical protein VHG09_09170 [Longimicrobiales bacterium]|nr:hypothetical protein [Longimicrobiales bacterium]
MVETMNHAPAAVEYRFNYDIAKRTCPLCGTEFGPRAGSWPFVAGTATPVCGGSDCPVGEDVTGTSPCDTLFEFTDLEQQTLEAIAAAATEGEPVAERLRRVALDDQLRDPDRAVLQLAAIDLQFCEAEATQIREIRPRLVVQTCGEAAAELLLSGCGDIVEPADDQSSRTTDTADAPAPD